MSDTATSLTLNTPAEHELWRATYLGVLVLPDCDYEEAAEAADSAVQIYRERYPTPVSHVEARHGVRGQSEAWQLEHPPPWGKATDELYRLGPDLRPRLDRQDGRWCLAVLEQLDDGRIRRHCYKSEDAVTYDDAVCWAYGRLTELAHVNTDDALIDELAEAERRIVRLERQLRVTKRALELAETELDDIAQQRDEACEHAAALTPELHECSLVPNKPGWWWRYAHGASQNAVDGWEPTLVLETSTGQLCCPARQDEARTVVWNDVHGRSWVDVSEYTWNGPFNP